MVGTLIIILYPHAFFGTKSEVIIIEIYGNGHAPSVKQDRNRLDQDQEHASYKKNTEEQA